MMEIKSEGTKMKLKGLLNESSVQVGKVYSNPYAKSWVKEEDERQSTEEMTEEQRSAFLEAVKGYRTYGESVYRKEGLTKVYESIRNMVEVANKVTLSETGDWFDGVTVGRHMKRMNESFKVFERTLKEVSTLQQRLESSYDEIGEVLGKYYEINELEEGNEFGAARAKAIAAGKSEFEVDGKTYKVTGVDKEDKENAKKFANESVLNERAEPMLSDKEQEVVRKTLEKAMGGHVEAEVGDIRYHAGFSDFVLDGGMYSNLAVGYYEEEDEPYTVSVHNGDGQMIGVEHAKDFKSMLRLAVKMAKKYKKVLTTESKSMKLTDLLNESYGIGELPSSKLKKMKMTLGEIMDEESVNEGASTEEKRIVMMAVRKLAKYRGVSIVMAMNDLLRAADDVDRDIQKGKIKK